MTDGIYNAKILSTQLYTEDHGIPTCWVDLDYGGSQQSFGGHDLRHPDYGVKYLFGIMNALRVSCWEKLPGTYCRAEVKDGLVVGIGHIMENSWFHPAKLIKVDQ